MKRIYLENIELQNKAEMNQLINEVISGEIEIEESSDRIVNTELLVKQAMTESEVIEALTAAVSAQCEDSSFNRDVADSAITWCEHYLTNLLTPKIVKE